MEVNTPVSSLNERSKLAELALERVTSEILFMECGWE